MSGSRTAATPHGDDPPTCIKCGDEYFLKDGYEITDYCDPCAQELVPDLLEALRGVLPYMEAAEKAGLVGDEGCHWPVELVRAAIQKAVKHG